MSPAVNVHPPGSRIDAKDGIMGSGVTQGDLFGWLLFDHCDVRGASGLTARLLPLNVSTSCWFGNTSRNHAPHPTEC